MSKKSYSALPSSTTERDDTYQQHVEEVNRRLMVQKAAFQKQFGLSAANPQLPDVDCFYSKTRPAAPPAAAISQGAAAPVKKQRDHDSCSVGKWDSMFSMDDITDQGFVSGGNGKEVEEAVDRKWRETAAYQDEQFLNIEERLVELVEEGEKWEGRFKMLIEESEKRQVLFCSAIKEEFRKVEEEGEKREARIKKLEEERERKEALLCSALEEMVSLKNRRLLLQEEEEKKNAAAGKFKVVRGWMIPTAVILAVAGITALVVKSCK